MTSTPVATILPAAFLVAALLAAPAVSYASVNATVHTGTRAEVELLAKLSPSITLVEKEKGKDITFTYSNLPTDSKIVITKVKSESPVGVWSYGVPSGGDATVNTLFPNSARGTYVLRVVSSADGSRVTESASFTVSSKRVDTGSSSRQVATYRQLIAGETNTYVETLGLTKARARTACKKAIRTHEDLQVSCTWNGESITSL